MLGIQFIFFIMATKNGTVFYWILYLDNSQPLVLRMLYINIFVKRAYLTVKIFKVTAFFLL